MSNGAPGPILVLDQHTANQIAAGEVVERPASVVKELVENALDAGAKHITVKIYGGGIDYIQVTDDGWGMTREQAGLAILRHATSKLHRVEDLLSLGTLGFRGEALPSIASVSRFTLITRPQGQAAATSLSIEGGGAPQLEEAGGAVGTTVMVQDLFYNVPARRKFLRSQATEGRYINDLVTKLALSRPDVGFQLITNDRDSLRTSGSGEVAAAIRSLYGGRTAQELLPVNYVAEGVRIEGYVSKPTLLKSTRQWQTFLVNGRLIQSPMLSKAMDHAYQSQVPKNGFPFAVLRLSLDPATVDVNVHPQKSEVKFSHDNQVYTAMYKALTAALTAPLTAAKASPLQGSLASRGQPPLPQDRGPVPPSAAYGGSVAPPVGREPGPRPGLADKWGPGLKEPFTNLGQIFKTPATVIEAAEAESQGLYPSRPATSYQEAVGEPLLAAEEVGGGYGPRPAAPQGEALPREEGAEQPQACIQGREGAELLVWPLGQVDKTFIIAQSATSLYLIDQHAAHERILYDKLVEGQRQVASQQLLLPQYLDLPEEDVELLEEEREVCAQLGVDFNLTGANSLCLYSLPSDVGLEEAGAYLGEIAALLREQRARPLDGSVLRQKLLHLTACHGAIKAGQELTLEQMRRLLIDLCNSQHPFTCPHGRPCMIEISSHDLYKMFKRTGF